jgi:arsenite methyltransferase
MSISCASSCARNTTVWRDSRKGIFIFTAAREYAAQMLGYDAQELALIPEESTASFAGVGNPHRIGPIAPGEAILDIGCGAGMDLLLAARRTGSRTCHRRRHDAGHDRARQACGAGRGLWQNVEIRRGIAEELPVESASVDVVISPTEC